MMTERGRAFDELTRQTAEDFARRAGIALHNTHLYKETRQTVRSRDEILSVVSHDLRSPLEIIRLTAELLRCYATEGSLGGPWLETSAQTLENATQRRGRLIDDLLDLASIRAGRLGIVLQAEQALNLLTEVSTMHQELATNLGRRLVAEIAPGLGPVPLLCDRIRILQVFGNLIDNALRYASEGTAVEG
jgi:signal transduction histidine kinase